MPVSVAQRQAIMSLLNNGLDNQRIAAQMGVSPGQVAAVKAHMTMGTYGGADGGADDAADTDAEIVTSPAYTAFGLERDLQLALRRSIEQLEPGLAIIDSDREQIVPSGRIDITARDKDGTAVVIELKVGVADREAIGQILGYMGDLMERETQVRGILVAREFLPGTISAARAAPTVRLVQYGYIFSFETVSASSG